MQSDIDIDLPEYHSEIVVEGLLRAGGPMSVTLSKSSSMFADVNESYLNDALVIITSASGADTLSDTGDGVYFSSSMVEPGEKYSLNIHYRDEMAFSHTTIMDEVLMDSVKYLYNSNDEAAIAIYFNEPELTENYYLVFVIGTKTTMDYFTDKIFDGKQKPFITSHSFARGEAIAISFINISKEYYEFLNSVYKARDSNNLPISEPTEIKSNITGGIGIFTGFDFSVRNEIIQ